MIQDIKLKHKNEILNVKGTVGVDTFFIFVNSLPKGVVPEVGDEILWDFENTRFIVKEVSELFFENQTVFDNYALRIDLP